MFRRASLAAMVAAIALTAACSSTSDQADTTSDGSGGATPSSSGKTAGSTSSTASTSVATVEESTVSTEEATLFDDSVVHDIAVSYEQADYDAMIDAYVETGEKEWIEATVTIEGVVYEQVGLRLKGNSSLSGLGGGRFPGAGQRPDDGTDTPSDDTTSTSEPDSTEATESTPAEETEPTTTESISGGGRGGGVGPAGAATADEPESLPWLIRLDEFVEGQDHQGYEDIVIRSNSSATSLNEAVALDLLDEAGLASQQAVSTTFSVNGGEPVLRLAIEHPDDDAWQDAAFDGDGALYKAESTGDWSYRGDNPDDYAEIWDQEGGSDVADMTPLIEFLQFLNESDDAPFAAELPERLNVDSFATYLAMMDLVANFDDIDGPGNNAYLWYDTGSGQFTVVPWDMNLAFSEGGFGGGRGPGDDRPGGFPTDGSLPEDLEVPGGTLTEDFQPPGGGSLPEGAGPGRGGMFGRSNILVERFHANGEFEALYQQKLTELRTELYNSGTADEILASRVATLTEHATELVDAATISEEADAIDNQFVAE
jgi:spore coat protein CotH